MIKTITTRKELIKAVIEMEEPILHIGNEDIDELNTWFLVKDNADREKRFNLPGCKLKKGQITQDDLDNYEARERKLINRYERWMHYVCGEYYRIVKQI